MKSLRDFWAISGGLNRMLKTIFGTLSNLKALPPGVSVRNCAPIEVRIPTVIPLWTGIISNRCNDYLNMFIAWTPLSAFNNCRKKIIPVFHNFTTSISWHSCIVVGSSPYHWMQNSDTQLVISRSLLWTVLQLIPLP
jgi:hypothetical protein